MKKTLVLVLYVLGNLWALVPNTLLGLALALTLRRSPIAATPELGLVWQIEGTWFGKLMRGYSITFGAVIFANTKARPGPLLLAHERGHTRQAFVLGPLFFPIYGIGALIGLARGAIHDKNPLEILASDAAAQEVIYGR